MSTNNQPTRIFNLKKDKVDDRDFKFKKLVSPVASAYLPTSVDLRPLCPPVLNQLSLGSCTANAGVTARTMLFTDDVDVPYSRLFLYYKERELEGTVNEDVGACMRDICKVLQKFGVCEEKYFPYVIENFAMPPFQDAIDNALNYKIITYHSVKSFDEIKQNLAFRQQPVLLAMDVFNSMMSSEIANTGKLEMPLRGEESQGGHAVLVVGYTEDNSLIIRNSWGEEWGDKGYFYMPLQYVKNHTSDYWVLS